MTPERLEEIRAFASDHELGFASEMICDLLDYIAELQWEIVFRELHDPHHEHGDA